jgi:hypothetical protein
VIDRRWLLIGIGVVTLIVGWLPVVEAERRSVLGSIHTGEDATSRAADELHEGRRHSRSPGLRRRCAARARAVAVEAA